VDSQKKYYQKNREKILLQRKQNKSSIYKRLAGSEKQKYYRLRAAAEKRNLDNTISFEEYCKIIKDRECHYCDISFADEVGYNLNRVDSNKGYTPENVKPCCGKCNILMSNFSKEDLKARLIKIYKRL
jgi:hypothetical protein